MLQYNLIKVLDFIQLHLHYKDRELLKKYIEEHHSYGTFDYAIDMHGHIVAICRWNMKDDVAEVLDFAIDKKWRDKGVGKDFVLRALKKFPSITKLQFQRGIRGDDRQHIVPISAILKRHIF